VSCLNGMNKGMFLALFHQAGLAVEEIEGDVELDNRSFYRIIKGLEVRKMNISKDIKPITYLKSKAADLLKQINETHRPVVITQNGEPRAVLQDPESYDNMRNAIGVLKLISQGEEDIRHGKSKSQQDVFAEIESSLEEKMK